MHVLADAATSVLAIVALVGGKFWGAAWLDPVMGLVGAVLVTVWAVGLLRDTGRILLDAQMDAPVVAEVREVIEQGPWPARSPTCTCGGGSRQVRGGRQRGHERTPR